MAATCQLQPSSAAQAERRCVPRRFLKRQELAGVHSSEVLQGPQARCMAIVASCRQRSRSAKTQAEWCRPQRSSGACLPAPLLGAAAGTEAWLWAFPMRGLSAIRSLNRSASCWALLFWLTWPSFMAPPWRPPAAQTSHLALGVLVAASARTAGPAWAALRDP